MNSDKLVDDFKGSKDAYVFFLEGIVRTLRQHHASCEVSGATEPIPATDVRSDRTEHGTSSRKRPREYEFVQFDRPRIRLNPNVARPAKRTQRWQSAARKLVESTPKAEDWHDALKKKGIYNIMDSGGVVKFLLDTSYEPPAVTRPIVTETNPLLRIREYAMATAQRVSVASRALVLANFQKFLVLCACAVLKETGLPAKDVLDIIRLCIGHATEDHCWRMLGVVVYLNRLIEKLSQNGWGYRAGELLLLWDRTPSFFYHLSTSARTSIEHLQKELCKVELTMEIGNVSTGPTINVPVLTKIILGNGIHLARISEILGYGSPSAPGSHVNPWRYIEQFPGSASEN